MKNSIFLFLFFFFPVAEAAPHIAFRDHQLQVDGEAQPQLFGAEVQYFRLRGGYGPNLPREEVIRIWNKALDRVVEAKMNAVSFYIPWDFHEYAEGKFDFDGTVDEDGDGRPDYPARDLHTFFRLVEQHGIHRIMVRPGPYINAEWGFLGFGAIPKWFHEKYPDSHMQSPQGLRRPLYDYLNTNLQRHTKIWFETLYQQVLHDKMGPGKPILFVQLDNETNFQWQSIFADGGGDYSAVNMARYRQFLQRLYKNLEELNIRHTTKWAKWDEVRAPEVVSQNRFEDRDWYRFCDYSMFTYLKNVRGIWESLGVREPEVLFTLAESYNAPLNGVLPNYVWRNKPGKTGLMTVNLYPKTAETGVLLNSPFKADLDVKAADEANDAYLGSHQEWVMGPEVQGGWWRGTSVTQASRQQTYLSVLGHGMKALFIYYFNEGNNWGAEWPLQQVMPIFEALRKEWSMEKVPVAELTSLFWEELQRRVDRQTITGLRAKDIVFRVGPGEELYFDAPLDGHADPRGHFFHLRAIGEKLIAPYGEFLARSVSALDPVAVLKDSTAHGPSLEAGIDSARASSDWTAGLLGLLLNTGINPRILHGDLSSTSAIQSQKVFFHLDTGNNHPRTLQKMAEVVRQGKGLVNFLSSAALCGIRGMPCAQAEQVAAEGTATELSFFVEGGRLVAPSSKATRISFVTNQAIFAYSQLEKSPACKPILFAGERTVGFACGKDFKVMQIGAAIFSPYNSDDYGRMTDSREREQFMKGLLARFDVEPQWSVKSGDRVSLFGRKDSKLLWLTVKTGARMAQEIKIEISQKALRLFKCTNCIYKVKEPLSGVERVFTSTQLVEGIPVTLEADDSRVLVIEKATPSI